MTASDRALPGPPRHDALAEVDMDFTARLRAAIEAEHDANGMPPTSDRRRSMGGRAGTSGRARSAARRFRSARDQPGERARRASRMRSRPKPAESQARQSRLLTSLPSRPGKVPIPPIPAGQPWRPSEEEAAQGGCPAGLRLAVCRDRSQRRPFIDPALISRHANFKVAARHGPQPLQPSLEEPPTTWTICWPPWKAKCMAATTRLHRPSCARI